MNRVFSSNELAKLITETHEVEAEIAPRPEPSAGAVPTTEPSRPIAIVGVHGIGPYQQYAFQDQLAAGFLGYLNAFEAATHSKRKWRMMAHWPEVQQTPGAPQLKPSALRLYRDDEHAPEKPTTRVYDVYEGYWSPYTKGKTNATSLLQWLVSCTFLATSSTARIPATWAKLCWDVGYTVIAFLTALAFLAGATVVASKAWFSFLVVFAPQQTQAGWEALTKAPISQFSSLPLPAYLQLLVTVLIGYFVLQVGVIIFTAIGIHRRTTTLLVDATDPQKGHFRTTTDIVRGFRIVAVIVSILVVALLIALDSVMLARFGYENWPQIQAYALWAVAAIALLLGVRFIGNFAVDHVLGDIQVYTTHDTNATFFAIRSSVISAVSSAVLGALGAVDPNKQNLYEKVHVLGHSLGSTIALDALIRLRQLVEEHGLDGDAWNRMRSFTSIGTALEKTKFFFDVRHPTVSAAQDQWANDVYGRFFSRDKQDLQRAARGVLYWSNRWYFRDIVANEIASYASDVRAGGASFKFEATPEPICDNVEIPHATWLWSHNDYLGDPKFWVGVGPVFTS